MVFLKYVLLILLENLPQLSKQHIQIRELGSRGNRKILRLIYFSFSTLS